MMQFHKLFSCLVQVDCVLAAILFIAFSIPVAQAQALRDPTVAPALAAASGAAGVQTTGTPAWAGVAVVIREGAPYLVVGTRLYARGETFGAARIERITETEVWLREAGQLKKIQIFKGVERLALLPAAVASATSKIRSKPHPALSKP